MSTESPSTIIRPTVGRVVWYWPFSEETEPPWDAHICRVWHDRMINVGGFDARGYVFSARSVPLLQEGDPAPTGPHCRWMPYQKGQASKTEALEAKLQEQLAEEMSVPEGEHPVMQRCPFCGYSNADKLVTDQVFGTGDAGVLFFQSGCVQCGATGPEAKTVEEAVRLWNKRIVIKNEQLEKLALFIVENIPGEPSRSEGAGDTAIRLLKEWAPLHEDLVV